MEAEEGRLGADARDSSGENVWSRRVRAGKRTYFFDVKATRSVKDLYIVITESRKVGEEKYEKHKLFLYKEDFAKFLDALTESTRFVEGELAGREPAAPHP